MSFSCQHLAPAQIGQPDAVAALRKDKEDLEKKMELLEQRHVVHKELVERLTRKVERAEAQRDRADAECARLTREGSAAFYEAERKKWEQGRDALSAECALEHSRFCNVMDTVNIMEGASAAKDAKIAELTEEIKRLQELLGEALHEQRRNGHGGGYGRAEDERRRRSSSGEYGRRGGSRGGGKLSKLYDAYEDLRQDFIEAAYPDRAIPANKSLRERWTDLEHALKTYERSMKKVYWPWNAVHPQIGRARDSSPDRSADATVLRPITVPFRPPPATVARSSKQQQLPEVLTIADEEEEANTPSPSSSTSSCRGRGRFEYAPPTVPHRRPSPTEVVMLDCDDEAEEEEDRDIIPI